MRNKKVMFLTQGAIIAALYVVVTLLFAPLAYGEVQVRFSEMLTVLPIFTPAAIPGLFIGCLISNILGGRVLPDIIFGSIATLLGALGTRWLRNKPVFVAVLPPIVANALIVPFVLKYAYGLPFTILFMVGTVGLGEVISCGVLGCILVQVLKRYKHVLFKNAE